MESTISLLGMKARVRPARCPACDARITVEILWPRPLHGAVETLALMTPPLRASYSSEHRSLTLRVGRRMACVHSSGRLTFCARDLEEARFVASELARLVKDAEEKAHVAGSPDPATAELWTSLGALDLYRHLPRLNCGECGEASCMAFAVRVLLGERRLSECPPLHAPENAPLLEELKEEYGSGVLDALGWT